MRLPRTTGALSGLLIILLGLWGGLIPFIGPYFHYAFGGYAKWHYTNERLWLCILPAIATILGGLAIFSAARRPSGIFGGWLALAGGIWFAVGPVVSLLWHHSGYPIGAPAGGYVRQMLEWLGYFFGLGVAISTLAAFAMGRFVSRPHLVVDEPVAAGGGAGVAGAGMAGAAAHRRTERTDAGTADGGAGAGAGATVAGTGPRTADAAPPTGAAEPAPGSRTGGVGEADTAAVGGAGAPPTGTAADTRVAHTPDAETAPGTREANVGAPGARTENVGAAPATDAPGAAEATGTTDATTPGADAGAVGGGGQRVRRRGGLLGRFRQTTN